MSEGTKTINLNKTQSVDEKPKEPTLEQLKQIRDQQVKYYKEILPLIRLQEEYETLHAKIAHAKMLSYKSNMELSTWMFEAQEAAKKAEEAEKETKESGSADPTTK